MKGTLQQQLKLTPLKMMLYQLLEESKPHRDAMNQILRTMEINACNIDSFMTWINNIRIGSKHVISFHDHEMKTTPNTNGLDSPIHIIAEVNGTLFKRILIDGGLEINIISLSAF